MFSAYFIASTDVIFSEDSISLNKFNQVLRDSLKISHKLEFIAFRHFNKDILSVFEYRMLFSLIAFCNENGITPLLNISSYKLETLAALQCFNISVGVHLKEKEFNLIHSIKIMKENHKLAPFLDSAILKKNIETISLAINDFDIKSQNHRVCFYSAHNLSSAITALSLGANFFTISPIVYDKGGNKALGFKFLDTMDKRLKAKAFALGGIDSKDNIKRIQKSNLRGFAGIRYFIHY